MAKRSPRIQVFIVSWFPIGATEASTIMCISRDHAARIMTELQESFAAYPQHNPFICIERTEMRAAF